MIRTALLALVLACAVPAAAHAGDIGCVWRALPEPERVKTLESYEKADPGGDIFAHLSDDAVAAAMDACVPLPKNKREAERVDAAVADALAAYITQLGSEALLKAHLKIEPTALERAYGGIEPKLRRPIANAMSSDKKPPDAVSAALTRAVAAAYPDGDLEKLVATPDFGEFINYFGARAVREVAEAKF